MSDGRYILTTISRLVTSRLIYRVLVAVAIIIVSQYIIADPALADVFEVANSASNIIMIGSEIGMSMVLMRYAAQKKKEDLGHYYGTALLIETLAWVILLVVCVGGYALFAGLTTLFWLLLVLAVNQAIIQYRVVVRSIYRSLYHKELITYVEVLDGLSKVIGIWWITRNVTDITTGAYWIALWLTITTIFFIGVYTLHSFTIVRPKLHTPWMKAMAFEGIWYSLQGVIMSIYFEIDKLVMRALQSLGWADLPAGDIARYGAASRVIIFFLIFHRIGLQAITPYLYASYPNQLEKYRKIVRFSTRYMSAAGIGLGAGIIAMAPEILEILYNGKFQSSATALQIFGLFFIVRFIGITSSQVLATTGQQPKRTKQEAYGVALNIGLDFVLIPWLGFLGGAIATLVTEFIMQTTFFVMTRRLIQDQIFGSLKQVVPALAAGGIMYLLVINLKPLTWLPVTVVSGALVYAGLLLAFRFFTRSDLKMLRRSN